MGIIGWIVFGALAGWIASIITSTNNRRGCFGNIVIGVIGAFLGGFLVELVTGRGVNFDFNMQSFAVAVVGAILLLVISGSIRRNR